MGLLSTPFRNYDNVLSCDPRARHASPLQRLTPARHAAKRSAAGGSTSLHLRIRVPSSGAKLA